MLIFHFKQNGCAKAIIGINSFQFVVICLSERMAGLQPR